jgi:multidrug efflux pump subunit AcrA (membrane-fusion protein)
VANVLSIPSSALIFDAHGLSVATVGADNRVIVKPVSIERDLGSVIEISSGLEATDRVIQNPPDGIETGALVNVLAKTAVGVAQAKPKSRDQHG